MKKITTIIATGIMSFLLVLPVMVSAQLTVTTSGTSSTSTINSVDEKVAPVLEPVKNFFVNAYTVADTWRKEQEVLWKGIQETKRAEVARRESAMDAEILSRSDKVLAEQQSTVVQGAGDDFDGSIFILKVYVFVLSIFVFIFSHAWLFYLIFGILVYNILRTIYEKIVDYRRTSDF